MHTPNTPEAMVGVPEGAFTSFLNIPVETRLNALDADIAILGAPFAIPYSMDQVRSATALNK